MASTPFFFDRLQAVSLQWLPLGIFFAARYWRRRHLAHAAAFGLCVFLTIQASLYTAVMLLAVVPFLLPLVWHGVVADRRRALSDLRFAARAGLVGLEFFAGIPGTIGGALAMNAGAFGGETWERVEKVETIDQHGEIRQRKPEEFVVHYREVEKPAGEWFLAGYFRLEHGDVEEAQGRIRELLDRRSATQPTTQPSCGSTFRNPGNDHAARLIESIGLKGHCIGGACVSTRHANFIINEKDATAADIEQLIDYVQQQVAEQCGVELVREVHIVGVPYDQS